MDFKLVNDMFNLDNMDIENPTYIDSVSGETNVILDGGIYTPIKELFKNVDNNIGEKEYHIPNNVNVLTLKDGKAIYGKVKYVMRHLSTKQMYRVYVNNTEYVDVTEDHSVMTYLNKRKLKKANSINDRIIMTKPNELKGNSCLYLKRLPNVCTIEGEIYNDVKFLCNNNIELMLIIFKLMGFFIGDGSFFRAIEKNYYLNLSLGLDKHDLYNKLIKPLEDNNLLNVYHNKNEFDIHVNNISLVKIFNKMRTFSNNKNKKRIPEEFLFLPKEYKIAFISGYFEADGTVIKRGNSIIIRLTSTVKEYLDYTKYMLLSLGICGKIFTESTKNSYNGKESDTYSKHLTISSTYEFINEIGFISKRKCDICKFYNSKYYKNNYREYDFELTKGVRVEKLPPTKDYVYDIEVDDTHVFFANNILVHNTDSLFLQLPISLEKETDKAMTYINDLQDIINFDKIKQFLHLHNIKIREREVDPLLICDFKNEYMIKSMVLYAKKRYISVIIKRKEDGSIYYDIDLKGVEGKRATNKFIKLLVDELIEYLKCLEDKNNIYDRFDILDKVIIKYINEIKKRTTFSLRDNIDYFALPVNVNKQINVLKNVAGYYKGTIIFDIVTGENFWNGRTGKGKWLALEIKDQSIAPRVLTEYAKYDSIKTAKKKIEDLVKDVTIPDEYLQKDSDIFDKIDNAFMIGYKYYIELLLKKIKLMYNPFDPPFCDGLLKNMNNNSCKNMIIFGEKETYELSDYEIIKLEEKEK